MAMPVELIPLLMGWVFTKIDVIKTIIRFEAIVIGYGEIGGTEVLLYFPLKAITVG